MFYAPNTTYSSSVAFGVISSQANFSRLAQLGMPFFL